MRSNRYCLRSANEKFGIARSIAVSSGDVISAEVFVKYVDTNSANWTAALSSLLGQIAASTAGVVVDGANYSSSTSSFPYSGALPHTPNGTAPKAYLNWLVFDKNRLLDLSKSGYMQITTASKETGTDVPHERLFSPGISITEPGYVYIYLSNEETGTPIEVYFDDLKVTQVKTPIVQVEDYYPFGLRFNEYVRDSSLPNKIKLFQGQEHVEDLSLNWDSFKWRNHQPEIGRFFGIDPLSEKYYYNSPFAFSENKVTAHVELEGAEGIEFMTLWSNAVAYAVGVQSKFSNDSPLLVKAAMGKSDNEPKLADNKNEDLMNSKTLGTINDSRKGAAALAKNTGIIANEAGKGAVAGSKVALAASGAGTVATIAGSVVITVVDEVRQVNFEGKTGEEAVKDGMQAVTIDAVTGLWGGAAKSSVDKGEAGKKMADLAADVHVGVYDALLNWVTDLIRDKPKK